MRRFSAVVLATVACAFLPSLAVAAPTACDQPDNTVLFCRPTANPCVITGTWDVPAGCTLDFGARTVVFQGDFNVGSSVLTVKADEIKVDGKVRATPATGRGGTMFLTAEKRAAQNVENASGAIIVTGR